MSHVEGEAAAPPGGIGGAEYFETAYAKLNLALHVRRRRADGYHDIETLFAFCADGDELHVQPANELAMSITGPFGAALLGEAAADNLVMRAARVLQAHTATNAGAALSLVKRLPVGSGIGGGSADAAAALRLLARHWDLDVTVQDLEQMAAPLGADVPACVRSQCVRGEGTGTQMQAADIGQLAGAPVLLVNPGTHVSTPEIFRGWDGADRGGLAAGDPLAAAAAGRNDLALSAAALVPAIGDVLAALGAAGDPLLVRMSGSGATCFAIYPALAARDEASERIAGKNPEWWQMRTSLRAGQGADQRAGSPAER